MFALRIILSVQKTCFVRRIVRMSSITVACAVWVRPAFRRAAAVGIRNFRYGFVVLCCKGISESDTDMNYAAYAPSSITVTGRFDWKMVKWNSTLSLWGAFKVCEAGEQIGIPVDMSSTGTGPGAENNYYTPANPSLPEIASKWRKSKFEPRQWRPVGREGNSPETWRGCEFLICLNCERLKASYWSFWWNIHVM